MTDERNGTGELDGDRRRRVATTALSSLDQLTAPPALAAAIEAQRAASAHGRRFRAPRPRRVGALAVGLAAAAVAIVLALVPLLSIGAGESGGGPSVLAAARLAERPASHPAPAADPADPTLLDLGSAGVRFPDFSAKFGWRATGWRADRLSGRASRTVFYARAGHRAGYTILAGAPATAPAGAGTVVREGTRFHLVRQGSREVVTWLRDGRTCVISAAGVGARRLLALASWTGKGTVSF